MAGPSLSTTFPTEVQLLVLKNLDAQSLSFLRSTCRLYRDIITTDCQDIWKDLHGIRWPNGKRNPTRLRNEFTTWSDSGWMVVNPPVSYATEEGIAEEEEQFNWFNKFMQRAELDSTVLQRLKNLDIELSTENTIWFSLLKDGEDIIDKVKAIIVEQREIPHIELCNIGERVLNGIARCASYQEWRYLNDPGTAEEAIEDGAIAIAKFYQNHEKLMQHKDINSVENYVNAKLEKLAKILQMRLNRRLGLSNNMDATNNECPYPLMEVIEEMKVFFETGCYDEGESIDPFRGNEGDYYNHKNSLIEHVLDSRIGIPITLAVVYTAIVRRACGVHLDIIGLPGHIVVGLPFDGNDTNNSSRVFVDTFRGGRILSFSDVQAIVRRFNITFNDNMVKPISHKKVWQRMVRNLIQCHSMQALTEENGIESTNDWKVAVPLRFFLEDLAPNVNTFRQLVEAPGWCPRFC